MRILDTNGRLFGKLNVIDALALVFVLCLLPMLWFGHKIMANARIPMPPPKITLTKAEYEEYKKFKNQLDNLLKEHKRLREYFE